jgi:hypothetical protein
LLLPLVIHSNIISFWSLSYIFHFNV